METASDTISDLDSITRGFASPGLSISYPPVKGFPKPTSSYLIRQEEQDGSKDRPYLVFVNLLHPEKTRDFEVEFVRGIKKDGFQRCGYHIRKIVDVPDHGSWEARVACDLPNGMEIYKDRAISIKGPSQGFWFRNHERYTDRLNCESTIDALSLTCAELATKKNEYRHYSHWLLLFPEGIVLDNSIFSEDDDEEVIDCNLVAMTCTDKESKIGKKLLGSAIYWLIADKKYFRRIQKKTKVRKDAAALFANI